MNEIQNPHIIKVKKLFARYDKKIILENIDFEINAGEIFMIIGGSGCGKTTLLNHMIGLLSPSSGNVFIEGEDLFGVSEEKQLSILRKFGVLFQNGALFASINVLANIGLPLKELTKLPEEAILPIVQIKLKMVGLDNVLTLLPAELSGGMRKRVAVARAMALDPKIIFLDEPTSGLDPVSAGEMDTLIDNLSKILGITFVIISHDLISIKKIAKRAIFLHQGQIVAEGNPKEFNKHHNLIVKNFFNREQEEEEEEEEQEEVEL
ncbi:MAG: ATP-binding cassette domain-containing protein [Oligoflexia bacterium]|nr:ATP-binding cassette domain-containing protein [Oligoflexia bacterium]